jgi:hypothetical protein
MGPVPISNNRNKHALIIIDHFNKWLEINAIRDTQAIQWPSFFCVIYYFLSFVFVFNRHDLKSTRGGLLRVALSTYFTLSNSLCRIISTSTSSSFS